MKRRDFIGALGAGLGGAATPRWTAAAASRRSGEVFVERWSWAMGQAVHLQLYAVSEAAGYDAAQAALAELRRVEGAISWFDDASDLRGAQPPRRPGPDRRRPRLGRRGRGSRAFPPPTGGAFDPAVEPLMRAWGFHRPRSQPSPAAAELAAARAAVRAARVEIDGRRLALASTATQLDLGGIGVGYGLDRAVEVLRARGIARALLDVSGDCIAIGAPPGERGWAVGVADPDRPGAVIAVAPLRDRRWRRPRTWCRWCGMGGRCGVT